MSRSTAREHLFQLTFEQLFSEDKNDVTLEAYLMDASLTDSDKQYVRQAYDGIYTHLDELKGIVAKYSNGFNIDRIYKPDLAAMIVSVYEMKYVPEVPSAVSINEAVELVKRYSTEKSKSYVNGVLASVNKALTEE